MQYKVMLARMPYKRAEDPDVADWVVDTVIKMKADPRISEVLHYTCDDTPADMVRNRIVEAAKRAKVDFLLMVDNDMKPDAYHKDNIRGLAVDPLARPFWESSFEWAIKHDGPCIIAAPYCGPPPYENVYVFRWCNKQGDHPNTDLQLEGYERDTASRKIGMEEVGALPTGLILIDMRAFERMKMPYFYYEWQRGDDGPRAYKASTEDVSFTRDASLAGVKIYCNWDAWAGHWKWKCVGRPVALTPDDIRKQYREAKERVPASEKMIDLAKGQACLQ